MAGVSCSCSAKGSVVHDQPRGQWLVFSHETVLWCIQYMWMLDGWELYVYGNLHVKCEIMFIETCYADETEDAC